MAAGRRFARFRLRSGRLASGFLSSRLSSRTRSRRLRTSARDLLFGSPQCRGRGPSRASCFRFSARMSPPRLITCCFFSCRCVSAADGGRAGGLRGFVFGAGRAAGHSLVGARFSASQSEAIERVIPRAILARGTCFSPLDGRRRLSLAGRLPLKSPLHPNRHPPHQQAPPRPLPGQTLQTRRATPATLGKIAWGA
jgi:hypothetical protein